MKWREIKAMARSGEGVVEGDLRVQSKAIGQSREPLKE